MLHNFRNVNFKVNHISESKHALIQANCLDWLQNCREGFDLILLDPPSFSNSKRMEGVLDIQRDHASLITRCMELLTPNGTLYFSNNLRSFKLDQELLKVISNMMLLVELLDLHIMRNKIV